MLNLLVCPTLVFDEVIAGPGKTVNWLVPTFLVCLSSLAVLGITTAPERTVATLGQMVEAGTLTQLQATTVGAHWPAVARLVICGSVVFGTLWSGLAIWLMGRVFLKSSFKFSKALEVAGLSATILALGTVVTGLLTLAIGDPLARPALSLVCSKLAPDNPLLALAGVFNVFHLWSTGVLAIGLARLARVSVKEAGFWVFGFWVIARMTLNILS
jgi:hypothetical protein